MKHAAAVCASALVSLMLFAPIVIAAADAQSQPSAEPQPTRPKWEEAAPGVWKATVGTPDGPLWDQVWVTLEEALLGFVIGVVAGVVFGLALGRLRLLAEVLVSYERGKQHAGI